MNEANRTAIVLLAAAWIVLMAVIIYAAWGPDATAVDRMGDFVEYLDENRDTAGRLIVTLAALAAAAIALLVIVVELSPEGQAKELRVERAGATTIVPAEALRLRLQEALVQLPDISAASARVWTRDKGVATQLNLTLPQGVNVASATQEASRTAADVIQVELGLPLAGLPTVRINFAPGGQRVASSVARPPAAVPPAAPAPDEMETVNERFEGVPGVETPEGEAPPPPAEPERDEPQA